MTHPVAQPEAKSALEVEVSAGPEAPITRWEQIPEGSVRGYGVKFANLVAEGADLAGEARLVSTLVPRYGTVLDAGCGMGRVSAALRDLGLNVTGVEKDASLIVQGHATYEGLRILRSDLFDLTPALLAEHGHPTEYDAIVAVGNVMVFLAQGTEQHILGRFRDLLSPEGRVVVGFHTNASPGGSRLYSADEFRADAEAAGLTLEHRFSTFDLRPYEETGDFVVNVLRR